MTIDYWRVELADGSVEYVPVYVPEEEE